GFGYVTLDSPQAAELCLAAPQVIDGRVVDMKRAVPEGDMDSAPTTRLHTPGTTRLPPGLVVPGPTVRGPPGLEPPSPTLALSAMMDLYSTIPEAPLPWDQADAVPDCLQQLLRARPEDLYLADTPRCYHPGAFPDGHFHGKLLPCGRQAGGMPLAMAERGLSWWK
ncbi:unnamed protein product, partial [Symbiodinium sp. KB8]